MKRILGWLIALSMLCTLTACSTTIQKPVPPPQSAFMEALNQALRRLGEDRYPNGLVESEDLCEIAHFEEEIYAAMQCTAGKTGTELEAARNQNRKCYRDILKKKRELTKDGLSIKEKELAQDMEQISPEDMAQMILDETRTFTQMGWRIVQKPFIDRNGDWDGVSVQRSCVLVLSDRPAEASVHFAIAGT